MPWPSKDHRDYPVQGRWRGPSGPQAESKGDEASWGVVVIRVMVSVIFGTLTILHLTDESPGITFGVLSAVVAVWSAAEAARGCWRLRPRG